MPMGAGDALVTKVLNAHGGLDRWTAIRRITAALSIGGPLWAAKGWPGALEHETVEIDTRREHSSFAPFTSRDRRMVFDGADESVAIETLDGRPVEHRAQARESFKGFTRATPWDQFHLGYFIGYAFWNYLTTPLLFTFPGVETEEIAPWREAGQRWRRLRVSFPPSLATHNPEQVFYFDEDGLQRRMDYVTEVLGSTLVAHYTGAHAAFDGLVMPTRRRVFRRNQDGTSNLNIPSITIDVGQVSVA
jgi:hypothetical protein